MVSCVDAGPRVPSFRSGTRHVAVPSFSISCDCHVSCHVSCHVRCWCVWHSEPDENGRIRKKRAEKY